MPSIDPSVTAASWPLGSETTDLRLCKGRYLARIAQSPADMDAALRLRGLAFHKGLGIDRDPLDAACSHVLVEDQRDGVLVCCFRLLPLRSGAEIGRSYSAQFYDLARLAAFPGPMVEMGRFCIHPDRRDADVLRVAWGALTAIVDAQGVEMLFGCASFQGTRAAEYHDAFALLKQRHLAPARWSPGIKAPAVFDYARALEHKPNLRAAQATMPSLLRTYLMMGGWVSDHAVIDAEMNTLHVFTGVEISAIPPARARLLRNVAGEGA